MATPRRPCRSARRSIPAGCAWSRRRWARSRATMRGRRSRAERLALALDLLDDPAYDALLEGPTRFEDLPAAMPGILAPGGLATLSRMRGRCSA